MLVVGSTFLSNKVALNLLREMIYVLVHMCWYNRRIKRYDRFTCDGLDNMFNIN